MKTMRLVQTLCESRNKPFVPHKGMPFHTKHVLASPSLYAAALARYRSQTTSRHQKPKKTVRFATVPPTVHTYDGADRSELQYTKEDYRRFEDDLFRTLQAYLTNKPIDETNTTIAGLERWLDPKQVLQRKQCLQTYKHVLLQNQKSLTTRQLRKLSEHWTRSAVQRAQYRAVLDAARR